MWYGGSLPYVLLGRPRAAAIYVDMVVYYADQKRSAVSVRICLSQANSILIVIVGIPGFENHFLAQRSLCLQEHFHCVKFFIVVLLPLGTDFTLSVFLLKMA